MIVEISHPFPIRIPARRSHVGQKSVPLNQRPADSTACDFAQMEMYSTLQRLMTPEFVRPRSRRLSACVISAAITQSGEPTMKNTAMVETSKVFHCGRTNHERIIHGIDAIIPSARRAPTISNPCMFGFSDRPRVAEIASGFIATLIAGTPSHFSPWGMHAPSSNQESGARDESDCISEYCPRPARTSTVHRSPIVTGARMNCPSRKSIRVSVDSCASVTSSPIVSRSQPPRRSSTPRWI